MANYVDYNNIAQSTENACGAFAISASLCQLNLKSAQTVQSLDQTNLANGYSAASQVIDLRQDANKKTAAENAYKITGNLDIHYDTLKATYYAINSSKENSPSALCKIAYDFNGNTAAKIKLCYLESAKNIFSAITQSDNTGFGDNLFSTESDLIHSIDGDIGISEENSYAVPSGHEVHLLLVQHDQGKHWFSLCVNDESSSSLYDPANGKVYSVNNSDLNNQSQLNLDNTNYVLPGLWIELSN
ncbi:hypothetical protein KDD30_20565 (plasmid) [Photobacterium sp. GJ3]|uniref:hypothetical protein n=1 Tax=Photobacterium sp. GJ3 TaxID=2829502 RepID=UPI001B8C4EED|nr:hypothetical protein [Photobacterium sp. GJ3]QUJ70488.1 hypothetical protein KDD30_20565 [Photobacterium sp. GJ3]